MPKTSLYNKKSNAKNSVVTQLKRMAKKGKMPTALIGGTATDRIKVLEAIQDIYPTTPAMKNYIQSSKISDNPSASWWYIRTPDGRTVAATYPQGATDKAKQGSLKMWAWNETNSSQASTAQPTKWSRSSMAVKDQQGRT